MAATMATASLNSSLLAAAGLGAGNFTAARSPVAHAPALGNRRRALVVRAQSNEKPDADPATGDDPTSTPISPAKPKPSLFDTMAFDGPAPERINGRLAMVGFVSALAVEASRGVGLLSQAGTGVGFSLFAYTAIVLSAASLVPLLKGESIEGRSGGFWNADAELWNGRAAMVGLVALAATEYLTGSPLISA